MGMPPHHRRSRRWLKVMGRSDNICSLRMSGDVDHHGHNILILVRMVTSNRAPSMVVTNLLLVSARKPRRGRWGLAISSSGRMIMPPLRLRRKGALSPRFSSRPFKFECSQTSASRVINRLPSRRVAPTTRNKSGLIPAQSMRWLWLITKL